MATFRYRAVIWMSFDSPTVVVSMRNVAVVAPAGTVTVLDAGRAILTTVFGDQMFTIIQRTGTVGIAAALLGLVAAAAGSAAGLRALAAASSRRRV